MLLLFVSSCFWSNEKLRVGWPVGYLLTRFLHFLLFGEKQATFGQDDDATNYNQFWKILPQNCTLTDPTLSCPGSLLKTTPTPLGYPWVSGGQYVTPEPRFIGLVLDYQGLKELEPKINPKTAVFDQIWLFLSGFLVLATPNLDGRAPNP